MKWSSGSSRSGVLSRHEAKHGCCYSHATAKSQLGDRWIAHMYPRRTILAIERPRFTGGTGRVRSTVLSDALCRDPTLCSLFQLSTGRSLLDRSSVAHSLTPTNICEAGLLSFASPGFVPPRRSLLLRTSASVLSSSRCSGYRRRDFAPPSPIFLRCAPPIRLRAHHIALLTHR